MGLEIPIFDPSQIKWTTAARDNFNKMNDDKDKDANEKVIKTINAGIAGIGVGTPYMGTGNYFGFCTFAYDSNSIPAPKDIKKAINDHPSVGDAVDEHKNIGYAGLLGFKHACFFFVDGEKTYIGGSLGGISILGSDEHNTFISGIISYKDMKVTSNDAANIAPNTHLQSSHIVAAYGSKDFMLAGEYIKHDLDIDYADVKDSNEWTASLILLDAERWFKTDSDLTLELGAMISSQGTVTAKIYTGTINIDLTYDLNTNRWDVKPFIQGGFSF